MNKKVITTATTLTLCGLLNTGCTTTQLQNTAAVAGIASLGLGLAGINSSGSGLTKAAIALAAVAIAVSIAARYQASQEQQRYAQARAYAAAQRPSYTKVKQQKKVRYVAVPVKKKSSNEQAGLMIYDTDKGRLASDQVYVPKASSLKKDSIVEVDGKKALLESSFTGA